MDDVDPGLPPQGEIHQPTQEDIERVEEARKILFQEGYIPIHMQGKPGAEYGIPEEQRGNYAINNFPLYLSGQYYRSEMMMIPAVQESVQQVVGRSQAELFADIDNEIISHQLDPQKIAELQQGSSATRTELCRYLFPVYESLVLEHGYPAQALTT